MRLGHLIRLHPTARASELSDEGLVAACATGDRAARALLFERHVDAMHAFIARMQGSDAHAVDDLVQATFLGAFRSAGRFHGTRVRAWLFGIATNVVRNYVRGEVRRKHVLHAVGEATHVLTSGGVLAQHPGTAALVAALPAALAALPADERAALILVDLEGESTEDAALALGLREGALRRRLARARASVRAALEGEA